MVSHNTGVAIAGASAVAAAVSVGVAGGTLEEGIEAAIEAARLGAGRGHWVAGADVASRIDWVVRLAGGNEPEATLNWIASLIGTSLATQEAVPAAFGVLAAYPGEPWAASCAAASLGGDADTIAAMTGAMAGAFAGMMGLPREAIATVREVNDIDFDPLAASLVGLREGGS
jgi:ADP-ribosylglycohydrolase